MIMCTLRVAVLALAICAATYADDQRSALGGKSPGSMDCKKADVYRVMAGKDGATIPTYCKKLFLTSNLVTMKGAELIAKSLATHQYIKEVWL
jgi:hypothetical protein